MINFQDQGDELTLKVLPGDKVAISIDSGRVGGYAAYVLDADQVTSLIAFLQDWQRPPAGGAPAP